MVYTPQQRALAVVVPPHVLPTRFTISTISRQTVKTRISYSLKRFPRTTGQKTVTTCAENVLTRTPNLTERRLDAATPRILETLIIN